MLFLFVQYVCGRTVFRSRDGDLRVSRLCMAKKKCPSTDKICKPVYRSPCHTCPYEKFFHACEIPGKMTRLSITQLILYFIRSFNIDDNVCSCAGDPHCIQFSQTLKERPLILTGNCQYNLVTTNCQQKPGRGWFEMHSSFVERQPGNRTFMERISILYKSDVKHITPVASHH